MALQIYNSNSIGSGIQSNLSTTDSVYIGASGFLGSTDTFGVYGTGAFHSVTVEGSVVALDNAIYLGDSATSDSGQQVIIGENAAVVSTSHFAIVVDGFASTVENDGAIDGDIGVYLAGNAASGASELVNNNKIDATNASVQRAGSEDFQFTNNGVTDSETSFAYNGSLATGDQTIVNNGKMTGAIFFGTGNDVYSGATGMIVSGTVHGFNGDDTFTGGKYAEYFQGGDGRDLMKGGGGADHFIFVDAAESTIAKAGRDLISDFSHAQHDRIDLSDIDAEASSSGTDEKFSFIGTDGFSGAEGELQYKFVGNSTFVQGDTDGDKHADFSIELKGHIALHASDFIL